MQHVRLVRKEGIDQDTLVLFLVLDRVEHCVEPGRVRQYHCIYSEIE